MKTTKLSKRTENFLNYSYKGNGKYYWWEQGSRHYNMSFFNHFQSANKDCVVIKEQGNDAPRGGALGSYIIVEFTEKFNEKYNWFFEKKRFNEQLIKEQEEKKAVIVKELTNKFKIFTQNNPDKIAEWKQKLSGISSKKSRMFKENKVARVTGNSDFWGKYRIFDEVLN